MKITKPLPPQDFAIRVAVETLDSLKLYQRYQKESCATKWDLKEMAGVILSTFLAEGDPEFLAWRKRQTRATGTLAPAPGEANGATDD
jgi:hypothetical protein